MKCPVCRTPDLQPTMIEEMLPSLGCAVCEGTLLSLLYYRHWAENHKPATQSQSPSEVSVIPEAAQNAVMCPKCSRVMTKYKLAGTVANRIDLCASCDEVWLDRGEWELLDQLQLSHQMPAIFTDAWQRKLRAAKTEETRRAILQKTVGNESATRVEAFREWLNEQSLKSTILTYLYRD
ncbi:MAG: zf-TFIIB domain-containing protein [Povalibacter sp.]